MNNNVQTKQVKDTQKEDLQDSIKTQAFGLVTSFFNLLNLVYYSINR